MTNRYDLSENSVPFVRDFNRSAAQYRQRLNGQQEDVDTTQIPCEALGLGGSQEIADLLLSWKPIEQWQALERLGAQISLHFDIRTLCCEVFVSVYHPDARAVLDNNAYAIARVLSNTGGFIGANVPERLTGSRLPEVLLGSLWSPSEGPRPEAPDEPSVHVQPPTIPASSGRRLKTNHKSRGKLDVSHSQHQGGKDSVDQCAPRRRPRVKRKARY